MQTAGNRSEHLQNMITIVLPTFHKITDKKLSDKPIYNTDWRDEMPDSWTESLTVHPM